jgi:hypothetical protein
MPITTHYTDWIYAASSGSTPARLQVNIGSIGTSALSKVYTLYHNGPTYSYKSNKTYQIVTDTVNLVNTTASFSVSPNWGDEFKYYYGASSSNSYSVFPGANKTQSYFHYSSPDSNVNSTTDVIYKANGTFSSTKGITNFKMNELDFEVHGFSYYKVTGNEFSTQTYNSLGWYYDDLTSGYFWLDRVSGSPSTTIFNDTNNYYPVDGVKDYKYTHYGFRLNNGLVKFIPYNYFNLSFNYQNSGSFPFKIYTSPTKPYPTPAQSYELISGVYTPPAGSVLIATITQSILGTYSSYDSGIPVQFYGISGNQYLILVGPYAGASASGSTQSTVFISNIKIEGGYHPGNNRQYLMMNYGSYSTISGLTGATYTAFVGSGNTINATSSYSYSKILSKLGNGTFKSGIWENGVWNSGWRVDENMYDFDNVSQFFSYNINKRWRIQISGSTSSTSKFNIGDNVAISNIVAVDINESRKVLKSYYTIINKTDTSIIVEFDNNFPIRRIEKDSDNHKIFITKNVWLSGAFLNGYYTGIWNYGLFKGYPLITEMYDSHWIDGIFDGGHFKSNQYIIPDFVDTVFSSGSLGLTFSQPHGLVVGDLITIDKYDKTLNPQYDGDHYVTSVVNDYQIITDVDWGYDSTLENGKVTVDKSSGLLQKLEFRANNRSKITSLQNDPKSDSVFIYDSWMDVVYSDQSAVSLQKPQTLLNKISHKSYSENNLYGYPTNSVLESSSSFRDSYSTKVKNYRLGTKYKIFADYIGDAGNFQNYFTETSTTPLEFMSQGWTYSTYTASSIEFIRTEDIGVYPISGQELKVKAGKSGGILDITLNTSEDIVNKTYAAIEKLRYTKVEFDLLTFSNTWSPNGFGGIYENNVYNEIALPAFFAPQGDDSAPNIPGSIASVNFSNLYYSWSYLALDPFYTIVPSIHFGNINVIKRDVYYSTDGITSSTYKQASYLPINKNVNHLNTKKTKKTEYFFNKTNLSMVLHGYSSANPNIVSEYVIDNLHFYEVDMVPFFQYFTEENINKSIQVPFQGISPFIDYSNVSFNFIDNLSIGLDSIQTQNSNTVISGVGAGIGNVTSGRNVIYAQAESFNNTNVAYLQLGGVSAVPSDIRLKTNINKIGVSNSGINIYTFEFIDKPSDLYQGVIAQELIGTEFESATRIESDGHYHVDYSKLDVEFKKIN